MSEKNWIEQLDPVSKGLAGEFVGKMVDRFVDSISSGEVITIPKDWTFYNFTSRVLDKCTENGIYCRIVKEDGGTVQVTTKPEKERQAVLIIRSNYKEGKDRVLQALNDESYRKIEYDGINIYKVKSDVQEALKQGLNVAITAASNTVDVHPAIRDTVNRFDAQIIFTDVFGG